MPSGKQGFQRGKDNPKKEIDKKRKQQRIDRKKQATNAILSRWRKKYPFQNLEDLCEIFLSDKHYTYFLNTRSLFVSTTQLSIKDIELLNAKISCKQTINNSVPQQMDIEYKEDKEHKTISVTSYRTIDENNVLSKRSLNTFKKKHKTKAKNDMDYCCCAVCDEYCLNIMINNYCCNELNCKSYPNCKGLFNDHFEEYYGTFVLNADKLGLGLFADKKIPSNMYIGEYCGDIINYKQFSERMIIYKKLKISYVFEIEMYSLYIDSFINGSKYRFINQSCDPNCEFKIIIDEYFAPRVTIWSSKIIQKGQQLTTNYGENFFNDCFYVDKCLCGSSNCVSNSL